MKNLLLALLVAVIAVAGFSADATAADPAISSATLADMGLNGMQVLSDQEGMQVRGKLFNINFGAFSDAGQVSQINNVGINNSNNSVFSNRTRGGNIISVGNVAVNSTIFGDFF